MTRGARPWSVAALVFALAATGCSRGSEASLELTGTLGGSWHFEAQCAYLHAGEQRFSLRVPEAFELRIEEGRPDESDVAIVAADGSVIASEGDALRVLGTVKELPAGAPCGERRIIRATELHVP